MHCSAGVEKKIRAPVPVMDERLWGVCLVLNAMPKHTGYEGVPLCKGSRAKAAQNPGRTAKRIVLD